MDGVIVIYTNQGYGSLRNIWENVLLYITYNKVI